MAFNIGLDDGHAFTKVAFRVDGEVKTLSFPSLLATGSFPNTTRRVYPFQGSNAVVIEPRYVSGNGVRPSPSTYHGGDMNKIIAAEAIYRVMDICNLPSNTEFNICFGLPISQGANKVARNRKKEAMKTIAQAEGHSPISINPYVTAQGACISIGGDGYALIVDIGGGTTDIAEVSIENGITTPNHERVKTLDVGVNDAIKAVSNDFCALVGTTSIPEAKAFEAFTNAQADWNGETIDLSESKNHAAQSLWQKIQPHLSNWQNASGYDVIQMAGGGTHLLSDIAQSQYNAVRVVSNPEFANALSFLEMLEKNV